MSPAKFRWGLILIQIGIIILLYNLDVIHDQSIVDLVSLGGIVLIAIGIEKVFTKTKLNFIAYLTSVFLFVGGLLVVISSTGSAYNGSFLSESTYTLDADPAVDRIHAMLDLENADLKIRDTGKDLVFARFDKYTSKPDITNETINGVANIDFKSRTGGFIGGVVQVTTDEPQDWYIKFSEELPLDLDCRGDESYIHLNLSTALLEHLNIDADRSEIYVKVGDLVPEVNLTFTGSDSDLKLRLPEMAGIRITGEELGNYLDALGFVEEDDGSYINEGYEIYGTKINIEIDSRVDNFKIDIY